MAAVPVFGCPLTCRLDPAAPAGWLLVAAVFLSPWAFGCRPYWAALILAAALLAAGALWCGGWWRERRMPAVPSLCVSVVIFLAVFLGVSLLNPRSAFDITHQTFVPNPSYLSFLPGTVDVGTSWTAAVGMLGYLCVVPAVADLSADARWRRRFLGAVALAGVLVSVAGLTLKMGAWPRLQRYLEHRPWTQGEIFGPFDYHGNAGAFLNLALPACAWLAAVSARPAARLGWRCAVGLLYVALFANNSRAALAIGICLAPVCAWIALRGGGPGPTRAPASLRPRRAFLSLLVPVVLLGGGLVFTNHALRPWPRLRRLPAELRQPEYPRYLQSRAAWEMTRERPLFGAGVGAYKVLVQTSSIRRYFFAPAFRPGDPFTVLGHTHEDYLQTLVEWGWIGSGAWAVLVAGAFACLGRWLWQTRFRTRTGLAAAVALAAVYGHALGDCPLQVPVLQLYAAMYLGLAWGSPVARRVPVSSPSSIGNGPPTTQASAD